MGETMLQNYDYDLKLKKIFFVSTPFFININSLFVSVITY